MLPQSFSPVRRPLVLSTKLAAHFASALALAVSIGCASAPTPTSTPGIPSPRRDTVVIATPPQTSNTPTPVFAYKDGSYWYDLEQTTIVAVGGDGRTPMEDTLVTRGSLTFTIRRSNDSLVVAAIIDSLSVTSLRDTVGTPRRLGGPTTIDLEPRLEPASVPVIDSMSIPASCDSMEEAARAIARDVHIRIPTGLLRSQQWTDSTSSAVCRGGVPMIATTRSTFEVQDVRSRGDSAIAQVIRRSTLMLTGVGLQGSRRIAVEGTGTSETVFSYDLRVGAFIESSGHSTLQLRFETLQQTEQVTQRATSRVRLRSRAP